VNPAKATHFDAEILTLIQYGKAKNELDSPKVSGSPVDELDGRSCAASVINRIAENISTGKAPSLGNRQALD
jgi:hypothetical protein